MEGSAISADSIASRRQLDALEVALERLGAFSAGNAAAGQTLGFARQLMSSLRSAHRHANDRRDFVASVRRLIMGRAGECHNALDDPIESAAHWVTAHAVGASAEEQAFMKELTVIELGFLDTRQRKDAATCLSRRAAEEHSPCITPQDLTAHVRKIFPTASVRELSEIGGGYSKRTCRIMLDGPEDPADREIIMRQDLSVGPYGTTVVEEYPLLEALSRTSLPVAKPLYLYPRQSPLGRPFLFSRKLRGKTLGGNVTGFETPAQGRTAALAIARLLAQVHAVDVRALKLPGTDRPLNGPQRLRDQIDQCLEIWKASGAASSLPIALGFHWIYDHLTPDLGGEALVHGDMSLANVLFDHDSVSALLDWEFAHIGDPAEDLAYLRPVLDTVIEWHEFFDAYRRAGGQEMSDVRLRFFEVFAHVRLAAMTRVAGIVWERGETDNVGLAAADAFIAPILEDKILAAIGA